MKERSVRSTHCPPHTPGSRRIHRRSSLRWAAGCSASIRGDVEDYVASLALFVGLGEPGL